MEDKKDKKIQVYEQNISDLRNSKNPKMSYAGSLTGYASIDKPWMKYYKKDYYNIRAQDENVYDFFLDETSKFPKAILLDYYGKKYTRNDIKEEVENDIKRLTKMGIKSGDTVSIMMLDQPEVLFLWYALSKMNVKSNMIKFDENSERIKYMLELTKSKCLFATNVPFIVKNVNGALKDNKTLKMVILSNITDSLNTKEKIRMLYETSKRSIFVKEKSKIKNDRKLEITKECLNQIKNVRETNVEINTIIEDNPRYIYYKNWAKKYIGSKMNFIYGGGKNESTIVYTGGTTGKPKGVILSNNNLNNMVIAQKNGEYDFTFGKTALNILPPGIAYYFNATHGNICLGVKVSLIPFFSIEEYPYLIADYRPNIFMSGPILLEAIRKTDLLKDVSFIESPISGGDKLFIDEEIAFNEYLKNHNSNAIVHQGYGMSECTAAAAYSKTCSYKAGSVGIPFVSNIISIFNYGTDEELKYNESGEICISGPSNMVKYFDNDEATRNVMKLHKDGKIWLHTGDIGYMDEDGHIFYGSRAKRMLTRNGAKVWLGDIEDTVEKNNHIEKSCCVKIKDAKEREVPVLHIVLSNKDVELTDLVKELDNSIKSENNDNYVPKYYVIRDSLPYSEVNKKCDFKSLEEENIFSQNNFQYSDRIIIKRENKILKKENKHI